MSPWLQIHICVLLWSFTAILGKLITLPALSIVWWRMVLVALVIGLLPRFWQRLRRMPPRLIAVYAGIGTFVALHWLTFYASIKLSNASIAATCMALISVFVAFVEPLVARRRFDARELLFGLAVVPGIVLVVGGTPSGMQLGIAIGVLSAFCVSIFGSLNKRFVEHGDPLCVTGIEMTSGALLLTFAAWIIPAAEPPFGWPGSTNAAYLLMLALGCTLLPFALSLIALRKLSAFSTALAVNLEPVYSILLAIVLLGEQHELTPRYYLGVAIILAVVFSHAWLQGARFKKVLAA